MKDGRLGEGVLEAFVKGLLQCLIQTNPCVIGGGWNSSCYCCVVVIIGIKQTGCLLLLCHLLTDLGQL